MRPRQLGAGAEHRTFMCVPNPQGSYDDEVRAVKDRYLHLPNRTCWPDPQGIAELGWRLQYAQDTITDTDKLVLASVVSAYIHLVTRHGILCAEPSCVNVNHLFLGTHADNIADKVSKGRQAKGVLHGMKIRGELHGNARFTEAQILTMLELRRAGESQRSVERQFEMSHGYLSQIENGKKWAWLTGRS